MAAAPGIPWRILAVAALLVIALLGVLLVASGSRHQLPAPYGPAANGLVAYTDAGEVYTVDPTTGASSAIVIGAGYDENPVWSRDGTKLAFLRSVEAGVGLFVVAADGSGLTRVTPESNAELRDSAAYLGDYTFSPDGREIAFAAGQWEDRRLWIASTDGSGVRQVDPGLGVGHPLWLPPDGAEIVFASVVAEGQPNGLYAIDPRTGNMRTILAPEAGMSRDLPTLSPDGTRIAYSASSTPDQGRNTFVVHVVGIDGTGDRALPMPVGAAFQDAPVWSNDGTRLALVRGYGTRNQEMAVAVLPADGSSDGVESTHGLTGCCDNVLEWAPDDSAILLLPENADGFPTPQILIDPSNGATTPTGWGATSTPTWQRKAP